MKCPHCNKTINESDIAKHFASKGGAATSAQKKNASRANGKLGGRPRKKKDSSNN